MVRFHWSGPQGDDPAAPVDWRLPTIILASVFLNFPFWFEYGRWLGGPLTEHLAVLSAAAPLLVGLFYLGPALSTQFAQCSLSRLMEISFGTVPAIGLRMCGVLFVVLWTYMFVTSFFWLGFRDWSRAETILLAIPLLAYLFGTTLQSMRTQARLTLFTNKIGVALLIAALIRAREGFGVGWRAFTRADWFGGSIDCWALLSVLFYYAAPVSFLAAGFGRRSSIRVEVVRIGAWGLAAPFACSLFVCAVIQLAVYVLHGSAGGMYANILSALVYGDSSRYVPSKMLLIAVTWVGAIRFGGVALGDDLSLLGRYGKAALVGLWLLMCGAVVWSTPTSIDVTSVQDWTTECLVLVAAVLTADAIAHRGVNTASRIDWVGVTAFAAGWYAPPYFVNTNHNAQWWHPWLLPSYAVTFTVSIAGRMIQSRFRTPVVNPTSAL